MRTCVATDFDITLCNGKYYFKSQLFAIVKRYYEAFGPLVFCSRISKLNAVDACYDEVTDMIADVVSTESLKDVFLPQYRSRVAEEIKKCDLVIARCPGMIAYLAADLARRYKKPYFAESMGCAWDSYWNHSLVGKAIAPYMFFKMKSVVKNADYALYVTNEFLQKRYPCKSKSVAASNVLIKSVDESVLQKRLKKIENADLNTITLMTAAAVDVRYKGQEYVIKAIPGLNKAGIKVRYLLVGGGDPKYLKGVSKACGVEDQVEFVGKIPLSQVFEMLDQTDIYIQPSLQEGLPRSVIEAMSRGCPVIGAKTAGIPELIAPQCVVKRKSSRAIATTILGLKKEVLFDLAKQNFEKSKDYKEDVLSTKRIAYYSRIKARFLQKG